MDATEVVTAVMGTAEEWRAEKREVMMEEVRAVGTVVARVVEARLAAVRVVQMVVAKVVARAVVTVVATAAEAMAVEGRGAVLGMEMAEVMEAETAMVRVGEPLQLLHLPRLEGRHQMAERRHWKRRRNRALAPASARCRGLDWRSQRPSERYNEPRQRD